MQALGKVAILGAAAAAGVGLGAAVGHIREGDASSSPVTSKEVGQATLATIPAAGAGLGLAALIMFGVAGRGAIPPAFGLVVGASALGAATFAASAVLTEATRNNRFDN